MHIRDDDSTFRNSRRDGGSDYTNKRAENVINGVLIACVRHGEQNVTLTGC